MRNRQPQGGLSGLSIDGVYLYSQPQELCLSSSSSSLPVAAPALGRTRSCLDEVVVDGTSLSSRPFITRRLPAARRPPQSTYAVGLEVDQSVEHARSAHCQGRHPEYESLLQRTRSLGGRSGRQQQQSVGAARGSPSYRAVTLLLERARFTEAEFDAIASGADRHPVDSAVISLEGADLEGNAANYLGIYTADGEVNGSPAFRHVAASQYWICRTPSGIWMAQLEENKGTEIAGLALRDANCPNPTASKDVWQAYAGEAWWDVPGLQCVAMTQFIQLPVVDEDEPNKEALTGTLEELLQVRQLQESFWLANKKLEVLKQKQQALEQRDHDIGQALQRRDKGLRGLQRHAEEARAEVDDERLRADEFVHEVERLWRGKPGTIADELLSNLRMRRGDGGSGAAPLDASYLGALCQKIRELVAHKMTRPNIEPLLLVSMVLYTQTEVDIDRLMGFSDCPPPPPPENEDPESRDAWYAEYRSKAIVKGKRNPKMFADANWAMRTYWQNRGREDAKDSLRMWIKWICLLGACRQTLDEPCKVTRGLTSLPAELIDGLRGKEPGNGEIFWAALSSTTTESSISASYCHQQQPSHKNVLFHIEGVSEAMELFLISQYPAEKEVLLPPCTLLQVEEIKVEAEAPTLLRVKCKGCMFSAAFRQQCLDDLCTAQKFVEDAHKRDLEERAATEQTMGAIYHEMVQLETEVSRKLVRAKRLLASCNSATQALFHAALGSPSLAEMRGRIKIAETKQAKPKSKTAPFQLKSGSLPSEALEADQGEEQKEAPASKSPKEEMGEASGGEIDEAIGEEIDGQEEEERGDVEDAEGEIEEEIHEEAGDRWEVEGDDGWIAYELAVSQQISAAQQQGEEKVEVKVAQSPTQVAVYEIDLRKMVQLNLEWNTERPIRCNKAVSSGGMFAPGDFIEYYEDSRDEWIQAKVSAVNADGTFNLVCSDGIPMNSVPAGKIRKEQLKDDDDFVEEDMSNGGGAYDPGDAIEYWSASRDDWIRAKVVAANADGTYKLDCRDGVTADRIRKAEETLGW